MAKSPRSGENRGRRASDRRRAAEEQAAQVSQPASAVTGGNGGVATAGAATGATSAGALAGVGYAGRVTKEQIAERAYQIYQARGGTHGYDIEDWLQAERELLGQ